MTLESAIKHCEEVAEEQDKLCKRYDDASGYTRSHNEDIRTTDAKKCEECAKEHRQLAEWLKDYQRLLKAIDDIRAEIKTKYESIPGVPWRFKEYDDGWVMALEYTLEVIDKHIGKEHKE